jgi:hypothetical protein
MCELYTAAAVSAAHGMWTVALANRILPRWAIATMCAGLWVQHPPARQHGGQAGPAGLTNAQRIVEVEPPRSG